MLRVAPSGRWSRRIGRDGEMSPDPTDGGTRNASPERICGMGKQLSKAVGAYLANA